MTTYSRRVLMLCRVFVVCIFCLNTCVTGYTRGHTAGNTRIRSYAHAKYLLETRVYDTELARVTLYCKASFDADMHITLPHGFSVNKYRNRAEVLEWEHVVAVEYFGKTFEVWNTGHALCVDNTGNAYKGRECASKVCSKFQYMMADMYNLYPSIGAVNALRLNRHFAEDVSTESAFGTCTMKVFGGTVAPPAHARGKIARAHLYMEQAYPRYTLTVEQRKLMHTWDIAHPVSHDECRRTKRIENIQGNENKVIKSRCVERGLW